MSDLDHIDLNREIQDGDLFHREPRSTSGLGTRIIPDISVPAEQTNASLRKLLREAHGRERRLREALKYLLDETALVIFSSGRHDVSDLGGYAVARKALGMQVADCAVCGEDHEDAVPLSCETGDGV